MSAAGGLVGYVRVSTAEQGRSGLGLDAQRQAIEAACAARGWELLRVEEDALSGRNLRRPGLRAALEACTGGEAAGLVVAKLDRLSRSLLDFAGLLRRADREGWNLVALDLGVDLSTPAGRLVANVMASVAEWEREAAAERTRAALAEARARGVRLGRPPGSGRPWTAPELAERIRLMRLDERKTLAAICETLNAEGIPTPRGGTEWRPSSLEGVLRAEASP